MSPRRRSAAVAVLAAAALGSLGLPAQPAQAAIGTLTARLAIDHPPAEFLCREVRVSGLVPMTQEEARALVTAGHKVVFRLWGEDPGPDLLLFGPQATRLYASPYGLVFAPIRENTRYMARPAATLVEGHRLNEDDFDYFLFADEVYAGVRLLSPGGATVRSAETTRVVERFPLSGPPAGTCKRRGY